MTIRIAVVGAGSLGVGIGREVGDADGATVAAVADVSGPARDRAGDALGLPADAQYADYEAMLDGEALDAVVVATPHALHYEQVTAALDRGLHVLCEKPLCVDLDHARDLVRRAESAREVLMVGYQRHYDPVFVRAREALAGVDPGLVTAEITQDWIATQRDEWRGDPALSGGGQLYDTGSHLLDAVLWLTDLDPVSVSAEMVFDDDADRVDKHATLDVRFAEGAVASVAVSGDAPRVRENIRVWSDDGCVAVHGREWDRRTLTFVDPDGTERSPHVAAPEPPKGRVFVEAIRGERPPPATARDAFRVTAVTEAAYESARTGERTPVDLDV